MRIVQLEQTDEITPNRTTEYVWDSTGVQSLANLPTGPTAKLLNETITTGKDTDEFGVTFGGGTYSYVYLNNQRLMRYETKTGSTGANTTTRTIKSTYLNDPLGTMIGLKIQDPAEDPQPPTRTNPNPPSAQMNYYQYSPQGTMEAINAFKAYRTDGLYTGKSWDGDTTKLNYFHNRYQDAYDSPMISQDLVSPDLTQPLSLNEYLFCLNNPFAFLDLDGRRTYLINGVANTSYSSPKPLVDFAISINTKLNRQEVSNVPGIYNRGLFNDVVSVGLEMANKNRYSTSVANFISEDLQNSPLKPNEKLNLIGYSGGGQIAFNVADRLDGQYKVNNLITLGSPFIELTRSNIDKVTNIHSFFDLISYPSMVNLRPALYDFNSADKFFFSVGHTGNNSYLYNPGVLDLVSKIIQ